MALEINSTNQLAINQNLSDVRVRNQQQQRAQEEQERRDVVREQESTQQNNDTQVRRAEALQQLERENFRVRRDDDSELNFQARRAVDTFNQINENNNRQDISELLGIDTFA